MAAITELGSLGDMQGETPSKDFPAPWEIQPEIEPLNIYWQMAGPGEDAMIAFRRSLLPLRMEDRMAYLQRHPPPKGWKWWIDNLVEGWNNSKDIKGFPAPWELHPKIEPNNSYWRKVGPGEDEMMAFEELLQHLTIEERMEYIKRHPWPESWKWWIDLLVESCRKPRGT